MSAVPKKRGGSPKGKRIASKPERGDPASIRILLVGDSQSPPPDLPHIRYTWDAAEPFDIVCVVSSISEDDLARTLSGSSRCLAPVLDYSGSGLPRADHCAAGLTKETIVDGLGATADTLERIAGLPDFSHSPDGDSFAALALAYSRKAPISALWRPTSARTIDYPICAGLGDSRTLLETLADEQLLRREFFHRVHLCGGCGSSRLSPEEQCSACGSGHLTESSLIHHYACGYQAPQQAFAEGRDLVCPKCRNVLHHFGVDYDKPGQALTCMACETVMDEPSVAFVCMDCGRTTPGDGAETLDWHHYHLTEDGYRALQTLRLPHVHFAQLMERLDQALPLRDFLLLADHGLRSAIRYDRPWSICVIDVPGAGKIREELGRHAAHVVFSKLVELIKGATRNTDFLASKDDTIFVGTPETSAENARLLLDRLQTQARETLSQSLELECQALEGEEGRELLARMT